MKKMRKSASNVNNAVNLISGAKCAGRFRTDGDGCAPFGGCGRKTGGGNVYKPIRHIARSTRFQPAQDW